MGTIREIAHEQCTGCGACYNKCPKDAIKMKYDSEGFLFPMINEAICIDCGLCLKSCPVNNPEYKNESEPECFAMWADDEIRAKSSSGGMFTVLAKYVLEQDGYVCGAAYTDDYTAVEHIIVSDKEGLEKLRGSKYVQSNTGKVYSEIKNLLEADKYVLFTGCPCQVAGLNAFLGNQYEKLYTVDLVCHGVPSEKAFKYFIEKRQSEYGKLKHILFRDKSFNGWDHSVTMKFDTGKLYQKKRNQCSYLKAFLELASIRQSCGNCKFAKLPRQGDITLADFWDVNKLNPAFDDQKGTSLVLVNNGHARKICSLVKKSMKRFDKAELDFAMKYNHQIYSSPLLHSRRKRFFELLDIYDFDKAVDYGLNRRFDIGYVGWWYGLNYGSVLTNFAMYEVLTKRLNKTVLMLDWPAFSDDDRKKPDNATRRFTKHFYETSLRYTFEETKKMNYHCETFLVGSDQLWNWYSTKEMGQYFFLDFADDNHKRIAYATSFGHGQSFFKGEEKLKVAYNLKKFDAISVREKDGVDICLKEYGVQATHTLDPVFLCPMDSYEKAISLSTRKCTQPYLLAYVLNPTEEKYSVIKEQAMRLGIEYKIILDAQAENSDENKKQCNYDKSVQENLEIADWLWLFKNAEFIVTDSYHGFCFSLIFHKQFICFFNKLRGNSRFSSLSELLRIQKFLINSKTEIISRNLESSQIDYDDIELLLEQERIKSLNWLVNALERKHKIVSADTLLYEKIDKLKQDLEVLSNEVNKISDLKNSLAEEVISEEKHKESINKLSKLIYLGKKCVFYIKEYGLKAALKKVKNKILK